MSDQHALWPYPPDHPESLKVKQEMERRKNLPPEARILHHENWGRGSVGTYHTPGFGSGRMAGQIWTGSIPEWPRGGSFPTGNKPEGTSWDDWYGKWGMKPLPGRYPSDPQLETMEIKPGDKPPSRQTLEIRPGSYPSFIKLHGGN